MYQTLLFCCVALIGGYFYIKWKRTRDFWKDRGVPYSEPNLIIGSLGFAFEKNVFYWMQEQYQRFKPSPYFGMWLIWKPALVVTSPDLAKRILVKDFDVFRDRHINCASTDPIGRLNVFVVDEPYWTAIRKRLSNFFTSSKLKSMHPLMTQKTKELVKRIEKETKKNKKFNIRNIYADFTTDVISAAAFGVSGDATLTGRSPMRTVTKDFQHFSAFRGLASMCIFFIPALADLFGFSFFPKDTIAYFRRVWAQVKSQRKADMERGTETKDLLDAILQMKKQAEADGEEMSDDMLIAQAAIFLQGGFDTSGVALTFMSLELAHAPEVQNKIYNELCEAEKKLGQSDFDLTTLSELNYLNAALKETIRKWPAMSWLDRMANQDYKVDDNLTIPKGMPVYVNSGGMHFDPDYFPEPHRFNPDRFLTENQHNIKPFTYLPFGEGPKNCIGLRFGRQTVLSAMSRVLLNYQLVPLEGAVTPATVRVDKHCMFLAPGSEVNVGYLPRDGWK